MIGPINRLKETYPKLEPHIEAIATNLRALSKVEDAIYLKTGNRIFASTQPTLGVLTRIYQYTMSFIYNCGAQNYSGANADIRCVAETICAACWLIQKPDRMLSAGAAKVSPGKILNCGYSVDTRIKDIYTQTSDIIHFHPDSFQLFPVTLASGERRWTALSLGWSEHLARQAVTRMNILHSIFSDARVKIVDLDERYYKQGAILVDQKTVSDTFICRGYQPIE
jgi:hypothetical protein